VDAAAVAAARHHDVGLSLAVAQRGLQRQRRNQSAAVAHSATAAAWWEQRGGCGGFTGTVREWANASAFECH